MTSNGNASRLTAELRAAGWAAVDRRSHSSHVFYRCPCGRHFATVTTSRTKDSNRSGPIQARIRRCQAAMTQTGVGA